jgi:Peroxisomal biogenesis factor 11 (PEX11)
MSSAGETSKPPVAPALSSFLPANSLPHALLRPSPFLDKLTKWLSTVIGTDQLIMLIQYTLDIITHHMNAHTLTKLLIAAQKFLPLHRLLPAKLPTTPSPLATRLDLLSQKLGDARIFLRLHGIIPTYQWLLSVHDSPPSDPTLATVAKLQTYANMAYFPLENAAYLSSLNILPINKRLETDLWLWSCRFWACHVGLEFVRLYRERQIHNKGKEKEKTGEDERAWQRTWWASLVMNLAYAPQTIHWSIENGVFSTVNVAYLGLISGAAATFLGWQYL